MLDLRLIGRLDHNFGWGDGRLVNGTLCDPAAPVPQVLQGPAAGVGITPDGRSRLLRDPLGLNKLFWAATDDAVLVATRPRRLVDAGCPFEAIRAVPPGTVADLDLARGTANVTSLDVGAGQPSDPEVASLATRIRKRLDGFCAAVAREYRDSRVFVCLSGGLDSAGVAVLARDHFPGATAVSFDIQRPNGYVSEDRRTAVRLARDLGLSLLCVTATPEDILGVMDTVLVEAIDWRDFNVHTALVNACIARGIAETLGAGSPVGRLVLTGDLPNEFLVDYEDVTYRGRTYYRLPRLDAPGRRAALVRGLETSHREIGPFEAHGLPVALPYAAAADLYLSLPAAFLDLPDRKGTLSRLVFGDRIPEYVYARPKVRAQVGDPDTASGVLAVCADHGRDTNWLRRRWADLHDVSDLGALDRFIRGGRYRSGLPQLAGEPA